MTEPKTYECRAALVAVALAIAADEPYDMREALAAHTDIPEDRLDFAAHEVGQAVPGLVALVGALQFLTGGDDDELRKAVTETIGKAGWIDDDKRDLTVRAYAETEEEGDPLLTVKTKLKPLND